LTKKPRVENLVMDSIRGLNKIINNLTLFSWYYVKNVVMISSVPRCTWRHFPGPKFSVTKRNVFQYRERVHASEILLVIYCRTKTIHIRWVNLCLDLYTLYCVTPKRWVPVCQLDQMQSCFSQVKRNILRWIH
jgi:hypothetical protein